MKTALANHYGSIPAHRNLHQFKNNQFDLIVIGGGITGATILWDAALRGMKAILLDKNDYASGTTQATSKLIHGGLRYLKNGELGLVRESLRERRTLAQIAPHAVRPEGFLMPIYSGNKNGRFLLGTALTIYDMLSFDRNKNISDDNHLPSSRYLDRTTTMAEEPGLRHEGLKGAYVYYDYANVNPERLCCEFIFSAKEFGAEARNYTEVSTISTAAGSGHRVFITDRITGEKASLQASAVVNAGGPWADYLESRAFGTDAPPLLRSKGIHIITRKINGSKTVALFKKDGMHFFIIPWRGKSIIGTTDTIYEDHPDRFRVKREDIESLLETANETFHANLEMNDVDYYYGGLRPLVDDGSKNTYNASRKIEIHHHEDSGRAGFFSVLGGKYTTSRYLAETVVDKIADYLPGSWKSCKTHSTPLAGGRFSTLESLEEDLNREFPSASSLKIHQLASRYGSIARDILRRKGDGKSWKLSNGELYFGEEMQYLLEKEEIEFASDLYFRRSGIGTVGPAAETTDRQVIDIMGKSAGWNGSFRKSALEEIKSRYRAR